MRALITSAAAVIGLALALPAAAQEASAAASAPAPAAQASAPADAGAALAVGTPVKDKTGATIGAISELKADAAGNKVATVKMGSETFAVDSSSFALQNGAAVINATQAELLAMIKKASGKGG